MLCDCEGVVIFDHCFVVHYLVSFLFFFFAIVRWDKDREKAGYFTLMHFNVI